MKQALSEVNKNERQQIQDEKDEVVNDIADDIFKALMTELKVELDLLLIKDPRRLFKEEERKLTLHILTLIANP